MVRVTRYVPNHSDKTMMGSSLSSAHSTWQARDSLVFSTVQTA